MKADTNIFLIGYRCCGKTSVGQALARRLGWAFVDTDQMVVQAAGISIAGMVADHGWSFFRRRERRALETLAAGHHQVVATGGGIVLEKNNVAAMRGAGRVVWLKAATQTIRARMRADENAADSRPSLTDQGRLQEIRTVLAERAPLYQQAAHVSVVTDDLSVEQICHSVIEELKNSGIEEL